MISLKTIKKTYEKLLQIIIIIIEDRRHNKLTIYFKIIYFMKIKNALIIHKNKDSTFYKTYLIKNFVLNVLLL